VAVELRSETATGPGGVLTGSLAVLAVIVALPFALIPLALLGFVGSPHWTVSWGPVLGVLLAVGPALAGVLVAALVWRRNQSWRAAATVGSITWVLLGFVPVVMLL
jgi:hypothetical protein